jgi:hypothetical protein
VGNVHGVGEVNEQNGQSKRVIVDVIAAEGFTTFGGDSSSRKAAAIPTPPFRPFVLMLRVSHPVCQCAVLHLPCISKYKRFLYQTCNSRQGLQCIFEYRHDKK